MSESINSKDKLYTHDEVAVLIKTCIDAVIVGVGKWIEDSTVILNSITKEEIKDSEINIAEGAKTFEQTIFPILKDVGIEFIINPKPPNHHETDSKES